MTDSPAPGTPQTGTKALVATVLTAAAAFVVYWVADKDPFTAKDIGEAALSALVASGLTGAGTFGTQNRAKR